MRAQFGDDPRRVALVNRAADGRGHLDRRGVGRDGQLQPRCGQPRNAQIEAALRHAGPHRRQQRQLQVVQQYVTNAAP